MEEGVNVAHPSRFQSVRSAQRNRRAVPRRRHLQSSPFPMDWPTRKLMSPGLHDPLGRSRLMGIRPIPQQSPLQHPSSWHVIHSTGRLVNWNPLGVDVRCIGLGGVTSGREFSKFTGLPMDVLYADPSGACCEALGFAKGFGPEMEISPYLKLLPMLLGIDSEGTIPEVDLPLHSIGVLKKFVN